jgi:hypothetical protein
MDFSSKIALVLGLFSLSFMLNLPMGFLRQKTRKFSVAWWVCIHAPIPFIIAGRLLAGVGFAYVPLFIFAAVIGQVWGGRITF